MELKQFLSGVEIDTKKLKEQVTEKSGKVFGVKGDEFILGLEQTVLGVQSKLNEIECTVSGSPESRLSQVTMLEILQKCKAVHHANDTMLAVLVAKMNKRGYYAEKRTHIVMENQENEAPLRSVNNSSSKKASISSVPVVMEVLETVTVTTINEEEQPQETQASLWNSVESLPPNSIIDNEVAEATSDNTDTNNKDAVTHEHRLGEVLSTPCKFSGKKNADDHRMAEEEEEEATTPVLPSWKLSEATRNLVHQKEEKPTQRRPQPALATDAAKGGDDHHRVTTNSQLRTPGHKLTKTTTTATKLPTTSMKTTTPYVESNNKDNDDAGTPNTPVRCDMNLSHISMSQSFVDLQLCANNEDAEMLTPQPGKKEQSVRLASLVMNQPSEPSIDSQS